MQPRLGTTDVEYEQVQREILSFCWSLTLIKKFWKFLFFSLTKMCVRPGGNEVTQRRLSLNCISSVSLMIWWECRSFWNRQFFSKTQLLFYICAQNFTALHCLLDEAKCPSLTLNVHSSLAPSCLFNFVSSCSSDQSTWHQQVVSPSPGHSWL